MRTLALGALFGGSACAVVAAACAGAASPQAPEAAPGGAPSEAKAAPALRAGATTAATAGATFACGNLTMSFGASFPNNLALGNQTDADCYAWQEFIGLNWPTSGSFFGTPGDTSDVAWQGYIDVHQLFQPGAAPPPPWGTPPVISPDCAQEAHLDAAAARAVHPLVNATTFSTEFLDGSDNAQAFPGGGAPAWLGDVNGNPTWYEVRVNHDEYDFVVQNGYYNALNQVAFYTKQGPTPTIPLQLPSGCNATDGGPNCPTSQAGAVEIKAAWMQVPNPSDPPWSSYKLSRAVIVNPATQKCQQVTVALVGLHIIHKLQSQSTWVWATFEHKNNAPNASNPSASPPIGSTWNYNSSSCQSHTVQVPPACQYEGGSTVTTTCTPANQPPKYNIGSGCPASKPTQITRSTALNSTSVTVNTTVTNAIASSYQGSVWSNYELVDVVWSTLPPQVPPACTAESPGCQKTGVPQLTNGLQPSGPVASTVLETYIQVNAPSNPFAKSNCILCHQQATVPGTKYTSDFSFALGDAQTPSTAKTTKLKAAGQ
ncbi:MAG: cytochrome c family protein, partial [Polyangiaceae bacterium]|nr:cytochrome c family protein [Polyangiaceae bacterium]